MSKVRKAIAGGWAAGVAAVGTGLVFTGLPTKEQVAGLVGAFASGFVVGFIGVYFAKPNAAV